MKNCWLCCTPLNENNNSLEHLIPSSLGGRKKISGFICRNCNNESGVKWDSKLVLQFDILPVMLGVKPDRNPNKPRGFVYKTNSGNKIKLWNDGTQSDVKPEINWSKNEKGEKTFEIKARNRKELKKILKRIQKSHPKIDINQFLAQSVEEVKYSDELMTGSIDFNSIDAQKSIIKTVLAMAYDSGLKKEVCQNVFAFLNGKEYEEFFAFYNTAEVISHESSDYMAHSVFLKGDPESKKLICYIEYFGIERILILLNDEYKGPKMEAIHSVDPLNGKLLNASAEIDLHKITKSELINNQFFCYKIRNKLYKKAIQYGQTRSILLEIERAVSRGLKQYATDNQLDYNEIGINDIKMPEFIDKIYSQIVPMVQSGISMGLKEISKAVTNEVLKQLKVY